MIEFAVDQDGLILKYSPEMQGGDWIWEELKTSGKVKISRVFTLERGDLIEEPCEDEDIGGFEYQFRFAKRDGAYHRIEGRVFGIPNGVLLADSGIKLERKLFVAERNVSIFRRLAEVIGQGQDIAVGGGQSGSIPLEVFEQLLNKFPNSTELDRYANARVSNIIGEYFDGMRDFRARYETYLSWRKSVVSAIKFRPEELLEAEIHAGAIRPENASVSDCPIAPRLDEGILVYLCCSLPLLWNLDWRLQAMHSMTAPASPSPVSQ